MSNNKMINILFVLPHLGAGGSERVVLDLARNLDPSSFNVYVACFSEGGLLTDAFRKACAGTFHIPKKEGFDPVAMWRLSRIIKHNNISIINAHHYMPFFYSFLGAKIFNRKLLVFTEHSVPEVQAVMKCFHKKICRMLFKQTDAVIGVSREITRVFVENYDYCSKIFKTIINGLDLERFCTPVDRLRERERYGLSPRDFVVGVVANFRKVKNHACLLRAFDRLKGKHPHLRLLFVGRGNPQDPENTEDEIAQLIQKYELQDLVVLAGYQEDIPQFLQLFDVYCLPSLSEGLPLGVLEAMAAKIPVVGSDVRGIQEIIRDGDTGFLFRSDDDKALADVLEKLILSPELCRELSERGCCYVHEAHALDSWISEYELFFSKLLTAVS
jgi:glycosyltransferase involved in cell wall biosynthesis